ncbi:binding-protein-dependent transport systems inner membrane component [Streptomyces bingchenggensis BCW-1]|uniref:Binding-protein-dependent transport systems inner membrane component n=1 Tax=Streptomyces bingchenggensis (strain BCW-1) TaxID=749414 RepID=D7BUF5_STRBB|nr:MULTISPECIES: carbohydrate ABC transporter permease [Streptomyces]ADI11704.1 binding-protein-dependent transport systems inner membrane component [Streptomyces bingchenggensis BCW-1]
MSATTTPLEPQTSGADSPGEHSDDHIETVGSTPWKRFSRHLLLCLVGAVMIYPLLWLVSSSVKPDDEIFSDLSLWPSHFDFSHYTKGWNALDHSFGLYLVNSLLLTALAIAGNLVSCSMAAYAFARMQFRGRKLFFAMMMGTLMLPAHVLLVPQYILFSKLGLLNTYWPLLVPNFTAGNAFFVFLMVQFMRALPRELDEAARIDGCGPFRIFWRIVVPLCMPAFATTGIFTFITTWNEFFSPLLYLTDSRLYTVPLALRQFMDSQGTSSWGQMFAMSVVSLAPVVGFFIAGQKYLVKGIATTGLK